MLIETMRTKRERHVSQGNAQIEGEQTSEGLQVVGSNMVV